MTASHRSLASFASQMWGVVAHTTPATVVQRSTVNHRGRAWVPYFWLNSSVRDDNEVWRAMKHEDDVYEGRKERRPRC
jgi:hypothetical protein